MTNRESASIRAIHVQILPGTACRDGVVAERSSEKHSTQRGATTF
jgi:hypothetical protein